MEIERHQLSYLKKWKASSDRKPLILRGARQVGKTTLVKQFSRNYKHYVYLNLELSRDKRYFTLFDDVPTIVEAIMIGSDIAREDKKNTLLFIDEIQEMPEAIASLRYFLEKEPEIHVIAAGSLLEHAMRNVKSFPVGRAEMCYLSPLNFQEFLGAIDQKSALEQIQKIPVSPAAHETLMFLFHEYAIVGGMPEIVKKYAKTKSVTDLIPIYGSIWETYKNDVAKYSSNISEARIIKHVISTAHLYVDQRIKFQNFGNSNYRSREIGEAMRNLDDSGVIQLIYPTTDTENPIASDLKKSPRLQFLDTGLINNELGIQAEMLGMKDLSQAYKGAIIPHLITQELISLGTHKAIKPNFWVREKKQSTAEVDLVIPYKNHVIPIEIKSGKEGTLKSLHQFIQTVNHHYAVRIYGGNFSIEQHTTQSEKNYYLMNLPYYLGTEIMNYIAYFVELHPFICDSDES